MSSRTKSKSGPSSIAPTRQSRRIPPERKLLLAVAAGGNCEFRGCNVFLFEHPITLENSNFSEHAHIYAFSEDGPRGDEPGRPYDIHSIDYLMLVCRGCHKLIDDNKEEYPVARLREMKREHEERIRYVTSLAPEARTNALVLKGLIANRPVEISFNEVRAAVVPRYPADRKGHVIDVSNLGDDRADDYFTRAERVITDGMKDFYQRRMDGTSPAHVSVFALASIPLLVLFGRHVSDKVATDFFQRHRDVPDPWCWRPGDRPVSFDTRLIRDGADRTRVGLLLSISGIIDQGTIPADIRASCPLYEIIVTSERPDPRVIKRCEDVAEFRRTYGHFLALLGAEHPESRELHLLPAVPAPVAVMCGHERLPKVQPTLCVYDNIKEQNGFVLRLPNDFYGRGICSADD